MPLELMLILPSLAFVFALSQGQRVNVGLVVICCAVSLNGLWLATMTLSSSQASLPFVLSGACSTLILLTSIGSAGAAVWGELYLIAMVVTSALCLLQANSLFWLIFSFELMTVSALLLLRLHSKYDRGVEALIEMYIWAMIGSFCLILSLALLGDISLDGSAYIADAPIALALAGFAIKVPLWPFSSWLLKAHVEASTEFSIFLSGFLVKFGVLGLIKLVCVAGAGVQALICAISVIGIFDATLRLLAQVDLKRIVAALTIIETNWMALCLAIGTESTNRLGCGIVFVHCITTTMEFYIVEALYRRYHTRSIISLSGIWHSTPSLGFLMWAVGLTMIGLPGTSIFAAKILFFTSIVQTHLTLAIALSLIFFVVLPVAIIRVFSSILGGVSRRSAGRNDISKLELLILVSCLFISVVIGISPSIIF